MCLTCLCDDSEVRPMANNNMTSQTIVTSSNNGPYVQPINSGVTSIISSQPSWNNGMQTTITTENPIQICPPYQPPPYGGGIGSGMTTTPSFGGGFGGGMDSSMTTSNSFGGSGGGMDSSMTTSNSFGGGMQTQITSDSTGYSNNMESTTYNTSSF